MTPQSAKRLQDGEKLRVFPTPSEARFLLAVYRYILANGGAYPSDDWLRVTLKYSYNSGIANLKSSLRRKNYLADRTGSVEFTRQAWDYCESATPIVAPLKVKLLGDVRAGKMLDNVDSAVIENWALDTDDIEVISIPYSDETIDIFALRVIGQSLEHEGINPGDTVVIRRFASNEGPRQGELVVTYYLPIELTTEIRDPYDAESLFVGPVIKYFFQERNSYYLGWRTERKQAPDHFRIRAAQVKPVGRVVGLYRSLSQ